MSYAAAARGPRSVVTGGLALVAGAGALGGFAALLSLLLYRRPPSSLVLVGFAVVLLGSLVVALGAYDIGVAIGVILLAAVRFEPAPADVVFAVLIAVGAVTGRGTFRRVMSPAALLVALFLACNLISAVNVVDGARAAEFVSVTAYVAVLGLWLSGYVTSRPAAARIARCYVGVAVASALLSTLALAVPFPGADLLTRIGRAEGLFKDPNVFGPFLVPAALILLEEILVPRLFLGRRSVKLLGFLVLTCGVLFSYSRAAWLNLGVGLAVVLVVLAFRRGGGAHTARALAVVLAAVAAMSAAIVLTGSLAFLEERAQIQAYDSGRFGAQSESVDWALRYPFGIGPGQFEKRAEIAAHSVYARTLAEEGLPGFAALLALLIATFGWAGRNAILGRDTYGIGSATLLGAWSGLLANGMFVDTLHWRHLWLVAALIWAGTARARPSS
jgi:hypothetical protein